MELSIAREGVDHLSMPGIPNFLKCKLAGNFPVGVALFYRLPFVEFLLAADDGD